MTRKLTDQSEEAETVIDVDYEDTTGLKDDQDEAEAAILAQFDADEDNIEWTASIYEVGTKGEKDGWLFDCSMADILGVRQKLLDIYGTGLYRARIRRGNRLARFLTYRIVAPRIGQQPPVLEAANPVSLAIQNQGRLLEELVRKLGETPPTPVQDNPLQMIDVMGRMMETMGRFMPQAAPVNSGVDMTQMFDLVIRGMEMGKDNSGGGESNVIDLIRDVLKSDALTGILTPPQIVQPGQRIAAPVPGQPPVITPAQPGQVPTPETPAPEATPDPTQQIDPVVAGTVAHLAQFIPHAKRGADPSLYADVVIDNVPREMIVKVINYPDIEVILQNSNPEIAENWAWFDSLLNEIRASFFSSEDYDKVEGQVDLTGYPEGGTGEEITGVTIPSDQAIDVPEPDQQPATGSPDGDPERSGGDQGDVRGNEDIDNSGKEKPGS